MYTKDDNEFGPSETAIIKEVYDSENSHDAFADELEKALEAAYKIIIIEPPLLGDETARWICIGNCLHKTGVITGFGAIACGLAWAEYPFTYTTLVVTSVICTGFYTISWQFDPCVKYQVYTDSQRLAKLPLFNSLSSTSPVVLIRKDDTRRKVLHSSITLVSTVFCAWRLYRLFHNSN